jgi:mannosyltransferase OCH1-like enzyme
VNFNIKIPKVIHQIHLGNKPLSDQELKWQKTWKDYNPDWEFIFWDDERLKGIDIINQEYLDDCDNYSMKSDILRFDILYQFGGLYIDTDFECLKPLDPFFNNRDFIACRQNPNGPSICGAFLAATKHHALVKKLVDGISERSITHKGKHCVAKYGPTYITDLIDRSHSLDPKYVYPFMWNKKHSTKDNLNKIYPEAYASHWWNTSWKNDKS